MKKYLAELIGTFTLVFIGCGSAALTGGVTGVLGILGIAFAFGLSIVAMAYSIGNISGCHVNPAVTLAMLISGKISIKDAIVYVISQILGALAGSGFLYYILKSIEGVNISQVGLGANGFGDASAIGLGMTGALLVEVVLTFIFVITILGVTSKEDYSHMAGLVIGLALVLVHIIGIPLTGTSVNPARSLAPALFLQGTPLNQVWVFIVAPLIGAAIAALVWKFLSSSSQEKSVIIEETIEITEE